MAQPTIDGSIWQLRLYSRTAQQQMIHTFLYQQVGAFDDFQARGAEALAVLDAPQALFPRIINACTESTLFLRAEFQPIIPTRFAPVVLQLNDLGARLEFPTPPNTSQVITRRGDFASRSSVGSLHLPPPPQSAVEGGLIDAGQVAFLNAIGAEIVKTIDLPNLALGFIPILTPLPGPGAVIRITTTTSQTTIRTMRRRTVGLGI